MCHRGEGGCGPTHTDKPCVAPVHGYTVWAKVGHTPSVSHPCIYHTVGGGCTDLHDPVLVVGVSEQLAAKKTRDEPRYPTRQPPVVPEINSSCTSYPMYNKLKRRK